MPHYREHVTSSVPSPQKHRDFQRGTEGDRVSLYSFGPLARLVDIGIDHLLPADHPSEARIACFMRLVSHLAAKPPVLRVAPLHGVELLDEDINAIVESGNINHSPLQDAGLDGSGEVIQVQRPSTELKRSPACVGNFWCLVLTMCSTGDLSKLRLGDSALTVSTVVDFMVYTLIHSERWALLHALDIFDLKMTVRASIFPLRFGANAKRFRLWILA